jgi:hypothetical protein
MPEGTTAVHRFSSWLELLRLLEAPSGLPRALRSQLRLTL